jgi:hypothetical protein
MNSDMHNLLLHLHSVGRWFVLLLLLLAIINSAFAGSRPFMRRDLRTGTVLTIFADLMLLIGIVLWYFNPYGWPAFKNPGFKAAMHDDTIRFFSLEHPVMMLIAVILIHIGKAQGKKAISDRSKHLRSFIFYLLALIVIAIAIPWPFRHLGGGLY